MSVEKILQEAKNAKAAGATPFCMGAAWLSPKSKDMDYVIAMIKGIKEIGLDSCMTLEMLTPDQARDLAGAGLDYYNHNLDTSPEFYGKIITTHTYSDRLDTLAHDRDTGINVCSDGIVGMGESVKDRAGLLIQLANMPQHPDSVPINMLIRVEGTTLADKAVLDPFDVIRTIAMARIIMPKSHVRLSAGREQMHALAYFAGANSILCCEKLLTTTSASMMI
jgi:biotin synthase